MKMIFLIRHGDAYDENWAQNPTSHLNKDGQSHAEALAKRFENFKVDEIYCSTMQRAKDTCEVFLKSHPNAPVSYKDSLQEVLDESDHKLFIDGFEKTKSEVFEAFEEIVKSSKDGNIFLFTHGHFIRFVVLSLLGGDIKGFFNAKVSFASVTVIRIDEGKYTLLAFNDCLHTVGLPFGCGWLK